MGCRKRRVGRLLDVMPYKADATMLKSFYEGSSQLYILLCAVVRGFELSKRTQHDYIRHIRLP